MFYSAKNDPLEKKEEMVNALKKIFLKAKTKVTKTWLRFSSFERACRFSNYVSISSHFLFISKWT